MPQLRNSPRSRLKRGLGAQGFSQGVQLFTRFAEVPLFLGAWGTQLYGEWLILAAIPVYLAMTDGGFTSAANHEMAMLASAGDRAGALRVFRSTWILVTSVSVCVGTVVAVVAGTVPFGSWLGFQIMSTTTVKAVLLLLVLYVVFALQTGLMSGAFWCEGRYGSGMSLSAVTRLLEFGGMAAGLLLGYGPIGAASGYLTGHVVGLVATRLSLYRIAPWLRYGWRGASRTEMRRLTAPAFASLAFPLGNALNIQGLRLVTGAVLGPAAVAVFAPMRTLSQLPLQPRQVINLLMEPEMALAFGAGDDRLFLRLFRRSCQMSLWVSALGCLVVGLLAGKIMHVWTHGEIAVDWRLFGPMLAAAVINSLWSTAMMVAYATNRHRKIGLAYGVVYGGVAVALALLGTRMAGFAGLGLAILLVEVAMAAYVIPATLAMTSESRTLWLRTLAAPPWFLFRALRSLTPSRRP